MCNVHFMKWDNQQNRLYFFDLDSIFNQIIKKLWIIASSWNIRCLQLSSTLKFLQELNKKRTTIISYLTLVHIIYLKKKIKFSLNKFFDIIKKIFWKKLFLWKISVFLQSQKIILNRHFFYFRLIVIFYFLKVKLCKF